MWVARSILGIALAATALPAAAGTTIVHKRETLAYHPLEAAEDYSAATFIDQTTSIPYAVGGLFAGITVIGFNNWDWGSSSFRFNSEGFFGKDTGSLGMDTYQKGFTFDKGTAPVLEVQASLDGTGDLEYQWQKDGRDIADTATVTGTDERQLVFSDLDWADRGVYRCIVRNQVSVVTSKTFALGVNSPPVIRPAIASTVARYSTPARPVAAIVWTIGLLRLLVIISFRCERRLCSITSSNRRAS